MGVTVNSQTHDCDWYTYMSKQDVSDVKKPIFKDQDDHWTLRSNAHAKYFWSIEQVIDRINEMVNDPDVTLKAKPTIRYEDHPISDRDPIRHPEVLIYRSTCALLPCTELIHRGDLETTLDFACAMSVGIGVVMRSHRWS